MKVSVLIGRLICQGRLKRILRVLKLTTLLLIMACLQMSAEGFGQTITLMEKNASLEKVLSKIEKLSGYAFWYNTDIVKKSPKVSLNVKDCTLQMALDACFKGLPISYVIVDHTIILKPMTAEAGPVRAADAPPMVIRGKVVDSINMPLVGATVRVKNSSAAVTTDNNGAFQINVPDTRAVLVVSYIGFNSKEVAVGNSTDLTIRLDRTATGLNEVTVTSYGIVKKTNDLGYSATTIKGDELDRANAISPITALQGKVAGAVITTTGVSGVQTTPFIQLRGGSSVGGNNQPIFVIDGNVLYNNTTKPDGTDAGSQLKNLNPDDYESITVLKGAAATALYGSRGLNGAVVITTKSGRARPGIGVEFTSTVQTTHVYQSPIELQNEFGMGSYSREGNFASDGTQTATTSNWGPQFDGSMHPSVANPGKLVPYVANPNNWKFFFRDGNYINNNITLTGGSEGSSFRLSYSNTSNAGILLKNDLKRNALDLKYSGRLNKVFSTELGVNYANTISDNLYDQSRYAYGGGGNVGFNTYYLPRNTDFNYWHQIYRNPDNSEKPDPLGLGWIPNAFNNIDKNNYTNHENSLLAYLTIKAQANSWLDFSARANVNYYTTYGETKNYGDQAGNQGGKYAINGSSTTNYNLLLMAHAVRKFLHDDLTADFRILNEYYGNTVGQNYGAATGGGLRVPNQFTLSNSVNTLVYAPVNSQDFVSSVNDGTIYYISHPSSLLTIGVGGVLDLSYKGFLSLEVTGRNDWLSTLTYPVGTTGANNYSVFYPSVNSSYSFYDHFRDAMPNWLSAGRLRASLAYVGNGGILTPYQTGNGYIAGSHLDYYGNTVAYANQQNFNIKPNPDLRPQKQRSIELGTNVAFLKNLVTVDFAWYRNNTFNQTLSIPGVPETGYSTLLINAGNIQNTGLELSIDVNPIRTRDWNLDIGLNLAHNSSKVVELYPGINEYPLTPSYEGAQVFAYKGGTFGELTVNSNTAFQLDPKTGFPIIQNAPRVTNTSANTRNDFADYQYAYQTATTQNPRVNIGKVEPDITGGVSATLRYKSFSLFSQVDGRFGGLTYSESYTYAMGQGSPKASLQFRDKAHGGQARTDSYTGNTVYDGAVPNAVFAAGEKSMKAGSQGVDIGGMTFKQAYDKGLVESWYAPAYYDGGPGLNGTYDFENGLNYNGSIAKNSWLMLREITFGYVLPTAIVSKVKAIKSARLTLTARNLGYLYKTLPAGQNPESLQSNDPFNPYITGGVPYSRNYSASLNVRF